MKVTETIPDVIVDRRPMLLVVIDRLRREDITIRAVRPVRESLEDLFMRAVDNMDDPGAEG